jgi:hypothetical protein
LSSGSPRGALELLRKLCCKSVSGRAFQINRKVSINYPIEILADFEIDNEEQDSFQEEFSN